MLWIVLAGLTAWRMVVNPEKILTQLALGCPLAWIYLTKLNYITWVVGMGGAMVCAGLIQLYPIRTTARWLCCMVLAFVSITLLIGSLWLGPDNVEQMLSFHFSVFGSTELYGGGEGGVMKIQNALGAIQTISLSNPCFLVTVAIFCGQLWRELQGFLRHREEWDQAQSGVLF